MLFVQAKAQTVNQYLKIWEDKTQSDSIRFFALDEVAWYYANNKPDSGYIMAREQLAFLKGSEEKRWKWMLRALNNRGWSYSNAGNYTSGIRDLKEMLKISEQKHFINGICTAQGNLGLMYHSARQYDLALRYQYQCIATSEKMKDTLALVRAYNNISLVYKAKHEPRNAISFLKAALRLKTILKDETGLDILYNNIGEENEQLNLLDSAVYFTHIALDYAHRFTNYKQIAGASGNLCIYYYKLGKYHEAYEYGMKGIEAAKKLSDRLIRQDCILQVAKALEKLNRKDEAIAYFKKYVELKDSVFNEEAQLTEFKSALKQEFDQMIVADSLKNASEKERLVLENEARLTRQRIYTYAALGAFVLIVVIAIISFKAYRQKKKDNFEIGQQKLLVEEKQKQIVDSINYAKRIQSAILAREEEIKKYFPQSFLLYLPKDIVAGDFYFFESTSTHAFYAAADCTGHGVPGALVSVVCSNALSRCIKEFELTDPGRILDKTRELVIETFKKSGQEVKDGMDISLISIDLKDLKNLKDLTDSGDLKNLKKFEDPGTQFSNHQILKSSNETSGLSHNIELMWAGANNPLWILRNGLKETEEIKPDKQPIGQYSAAQPFTTHRVTINQGETLYLFTDGFADQFGGEKGKKFKYSAFNKCLTELRNLSPDEQKQKLENIFTEWKGDLEQTDDVCVIGIQF